MAQVQVVFTTAGRALYQADSAAGRTTQITSVEVGQANRVPAVGDIGVQTPFAPRRIFTNPAGIATGPDLQWDFQDTSGDTYTVKEIVFFSGSTAVFSGAVAEGAILTKPADTSALYPLVIHIDGVSLDTFTFSTVATPMGSEAIAGLLQLATQAEGVTGTAADKATSVLRVVEMRTAWWNGLSIAASKIASGVLNAARIPGLAASKITSGLFHADRVSWYGTQAQYDALSNKDANTYYDIHE